MILFAYAGNMDLEGFVKTVPSAKKIGIGKLPGYNFIFNKTADDDSSKANVVRSFEPDAMVFGVLIEFNDNEKSNFFDPDTWSSGLKLEPANCTDMDGNLYQAEVFTAEPHAVNTHLLPYDWYYQKIIKLATEAGLPETYISQLSLMAYKTDPDEARRARRMKKL